MADQVYSVECGFFNSIGGDRTYTADDMMRPYNRLVSNGVFATNQGTPSTDLQVVSSGDGMVITVNAGEGVFNGRWFKNPSGILVTVPDNTNILPRVDSVIVQVDARSSGRVGNIVYRTGTPATYPAPPFINEVTNVWEYRIANIRVEPNATSIEQSKITDCRGTDTPWVEALIIQPDVSTLFYQWQSALSDFYNEATEEYEDYVTEQQQAWEDFMSSLTEELSASTNVIMLTSRYVTSGSENYNIPIGITSFNKNTDVLLVFINGLMAGPNMWTMNNAGTSIVLENPLGSDQSVSFVALHSVISSDLQSVASMILSLDAEVSALSADTGWRTLPLSNGASTEYGANQLSSRKVGNRVYISGYLFGATSVGTIYSSVAGSYIPSRNIYIDCPVLDLSGASPLTSNGTIKKSCIFRIDQGGDITLFATSGAISATDTIVFEGCYVV